MSATMTAPATIAGPDQDEQRLVLHGIDWANYVTIGDVLGERAGARLIFLDGRLTFLTKSHRHEWFAGCLDHLVVAVALACEVFCEPAGETTFRREDSGAGVEGDRTYYLGPNAEVMRGPLQEIDLTTQPPPDLAVEVEVTHPADEAMRTYGRLGVPEVWRFDVDRGTVGFWLRREDGTYFASSRSLALPALHVDDVRDQMDLAGDLGFTRWKKQLDGWLLDVIVPRLGDGDRPDG